MSWFIAYVAGSYRPTQWSSTQYYVGSLGIPGGTTVVGATVFGSQQGNYEYAADPLWGGTAAWTSTQCSVIGNTSSYWESGNTEFVNTSGDAWSAVQGLNANGGGYVVVAPTGENTSGDATTSVNVEAQYAYPPTNIRWRQVTSGNGTQFTIHWSTNGNQSDISYILKRETLQGGTVTQGWTTIYEGGATSFQTSDQTCGVGYVYSVSAYGQQGPGVTTPWDQSGTLSEYPCSESVPYVTPTSVTVSWPQVTSSTVPIVVWCEEGTPGAGVSCAQVAETLSAGDSSATLTGLTPNAEYAVWACSQTNSWGCPAVNVWTDAVSPALSPYNNSSGIPYNAQPLTWTTAGNAPGSVYQLQQGTYSQSGAWQGGTVVYQGTGTSFTATQNAGTSYAYNVWAVNAGYGNDTPASNTVDTQVASTPSLTITGSTTATVSWATVSNMSTTGVACAPNGSTTWFYPPQATGGATSVDVTGLTPNTSYWCATYAIAANEGIEWWQGDAQGNQSTWANPPTNLTASTSSAGVAAPDQPLSWGTGGNPAGTTYVLEQNGTQIYSGIATSFTAAQTAGGSYTYEVFAANSGGGLSGGSNGVVTQVASAPALTATGSSTATVAWPGVPAMQDVAVWCGAVGGGPPWANEGTASGGATALAVTGLSPNTLYQCDTAATATNQGMAWLEYSGEVYTDAVPPAGSALGPLTQTTATLAWSPNGNGSGTDYQAEVLPCGGTTPVATSSTQTALAWTATGLTAGTCYTGAVVALNHAGVATAADTTAQAVTVPDAPSSVTGADGGLGWNATAGRGYVNLSWPTVQGATGYTVWVWDGVQYEKFDVTGSTLHWSSQQALIYPPDSSLYPNVASGSATPPVLNHSQAGLNLRDLPQDLYCTTAASGAGYCNGSTQNYWFTVSAYNASGNSASYQVPGDSVAAADYYEPTLPLQTDPNAPTISRFTLGSGGQYTYAQQVPWTLSATESPSGIAAYAMSSDGITWTTTDVSGCAVGQEAACGSSLSASGNWALSVGPGLKTIYVKVESTAGVWSLVQSAQVYLMADTTKPIVNAVLDGGIATTNSTSATLAVTVSDPVARVAGLTFESRYSVDGGQTWSAWTSEGSNTSWTAEVTLPGGASGSRTVAVQVQDSDDNLGQGSASIPYLNPAETQPGTAGAGAATACNWPVGSAPVSATCVTQPDVTATLAPPSGEVEMRASLNGATWGPWRPVATSLPVTLPHTGLNTVWVQYEDASGDIAAATNYNPAYYVYDPGPPAISVSWQGGAAATSSSGTAILLLQATDPVGTTGMTVTATENGSTVYSGAYSATIPLTLTGSGYETVDVAVADVAGNTAATSAGIYVQ